MQPVGADNNFVYQSLLMGGILLVFYLFMIRPQQRRQKEQSIFLGKIKKGTNLITIGGIYGRVYEVTSDTVTLEVDNKGSKITVLKGAISMESTRQKYGSKNK